MVASTVTSWDLVKPICEALELGSPSLIRRIVINPTSVEVEFFRLNRNGRKYVNLSTGEPATVTQKIPVSGGRP